MNLSLQQWIGLALLAVLFFGGVMRPCIKWLINNLSSNEQKERDAKSNRRGRLQPNIEETGDDWIKHDGVYRRELILEKLPQHVDAAWFEKISSALPQTCSSSLTFIPKESFNEDYPSDFVIGELDDISKPKHSDEEVAYVSVYFSIFDKDMDEVEQHTEWVERVISSEGGSVKRVRGRYIQAMKNSGPLNSQHHSYPLEVPMNAIATLSLPIPAPTYRDYTCKYSYTPDPKYLD